MDLRKHGARRGASSLDAISSTQCPWRAARIMQVAALVRTTRQIGTAIVVEEEMLNLLWAFALVFFVMWMFGFAFHFTLAGFASVLFVLTFSSIVTRTITDGRIG